MCWGSMVPASSGCSSGSACFSSWSCCPMACGRRWPARSVSVPANAGSRNMPALLDVTGLSKRFSGLRAVQDVSFSVPQGAIFAVIGPNGAGKTTVFNMVAGVFPPDEGTIRFAGERIDGLHPEIVCQRGIGRTFQLVRPFPALTVEDNVIVGALLRRPDGDAAR